jgi:hypothetical protein
MRTEVLTAKMSMLVFGAIMLCELVGKYQRFGETYCLHLQGCSSETMVSTYNSSRRYNKADRQRHKSPAFMELDFTQSLSLVCSLGQMNPVHTATHYFSGLED